VIVVAGFNSTLDKYAEADEIRAGAVNRLATVAAYPGGKGVHVAQTIALLGEPVRLVGIVDDLHAAQFEQALTRRAVEWRGVGIEQPIRSCYAIRDRRGELTEIREPGPDLSEAQIARLEETFIGACGGAAFAILSGSLPRGGSPDLYARLVVRLRELGLPCLVDSSSRALASAVDAKPAILKPNADEASQLTGERISDISSAARAAAALAARGIERVVVSLGAGGAMAAWDGRLARIRVPVQTGISAVGSGDCFVGGLAVGIVQQRGVDEMLRMASACGAANVLSSEPGFFRVADARRLANDVGIEWQ
jgi:1-phosphofructokinase family hexose kinase